MTAEHDPFDLSNPKHIRAVMARTGIHPEALRLWWQPDADVDVNPMDNPEVQATVRHFLGRVWQACLNAEAGGQAMTPQRIQLKRTRGWRKPQGAVVVSRPSRWGNPLRMGGDREAAAEWFGVMLDLRRAGKLPPTHRYGHEYPADDEIRAELAGHDLACWCPLHDAAGKRQPCHADVLLAIANNAEVKP